MNNVKNLCNIILSFAMTTGVVLCFSLLGLTISTGGFAVCYATILYSMKD